jgi:hypothetical protein
VKFMAARDWFAPRMGSVAVDVARILVEEAGGRCQVCGYDRCIAALQFHHIDPATKLFGLGSRGLAQALDKLRAEAAKCVLLCANCHAEVEAGVTRLPFPDAAARSPA